MKKILSIFGTITLIGTSITSLVACNNTPQEYTKEQLKELKGKNNITTKEGILEWITSQEKPFNQIDDKWYFVVWRVDESADWNITKFKNNTTIPRDTKLNIDNWKNYGLYLANSPIFKRMIGLSIWRNNALGYYSWWDKSDNYFKAVYRWNNDSELNIDVENKLKSYLDL